MKFVNFINSLKVKGSEQSESLIFMERVNIAKKILSNNKYYKRPIYAPEYLTDFGLRKSDSQSILFNHIKSRLNINLPTTDDIREDLKVAPIEMLPKLIDAIILVIGDYDSCYSTVKSRFLDIIRSNNFDDLVRIGTLCGIMGDSALAKKIFKKILTLNITNEDSRVIKHRLSVLNLKRSSDIESFYLEISDLISDCLTQSDTEETIALLDNLVALDWVQEVKQHNLRLQDSRLILLNAKTIIRYAINYYGDEYPELLSELIRYNSQITINQIQLELEINNLDIACKLAQDNIFFMKKYKNFDYLAEALATQAFVYYAMEDYKLAIKYAVDAIDEYNRVGHFVGIDQERKLIATSLNSIGYDNIGKIVLQKNIYDKTEYTKLFKEHGIDAI